MSTPIEAAPEPAGAQESRGAFPPAFRRLMANSLVAGVTSTFLWFALTFWVYLETRSVVATGVIGGTFSLVAAIVGPLIGTYVDHHRKHTSLVLTSAMAAASFAVATVVFYSVDADDLLQLDGPWFWLLVASTLMGSVAGNARAVVLATCVTILVPARHRDRANGVVGTVTTDRPDPCMSSSMPRCSRAPSSMRTVRSATPIGVGCRVSSVTIWPTCCERSRSWRCSQR